MKRLYNIGRHEKIVALANGAIDGVPKSEAESALFFFNPMNEVKIFIEHLQMASRRDERYG